MLFVTNRRLMEGSCSSRGRKVTFDLADNDPSASIYFCEKRSDDHYTELTSAVFFEHLREASAYQILLYIHGYNTLPDRALSRSRELQNMFDRLMPDGVQVVPVIWPCDDDFGMLRDYWDDQFASEQSAFSFVRGLSRLVSWRNKFQKKQACLKHINVLAHSMGSRVLEQTLIRFVEHHGEQLLFRHVFLAAPDLPDEALNLDQPGKAIARCARNVSVYHASDDFALRTSKAVNLRNRILTRRLGHSGPPDPKNVPCNIVSIDCNSFNSRYDRLGHTYFSADRKGEPGLLVSHMAHTIQTGEVAGVNPDREHIGGHQWSLNDKNWSLAKLEANRSNSNKPDRIKNTA